MDYNNKVVQSCFIGATGFQMYHTCNSVDLCNRNMFKSLQQRLNITTADNGHNQLKQTSKPNGQTGGYPFSKMPVYTSSPPSTRPNHKDFMMYQPQPAPQPMPQPLPQPQPQGPTLPMPPPMPWATTTTTTSGGFITVPSSTVYGFVGYSSSYTFMSTAGTLPPVPVTPQPSTPKPASSTSTTRKYPCNYYQAGNYGSGYYSPAYNYPCRKSDVASFTANVKLIFLCAHILIISLFLTYF